MSQKFEEKCKKYLSYPAHASTMFSVLHLHIFVLVPYFAAAHPLPESVNRFIIFSHIFLKHCHPQNFAAPCLFLACDVDHCLSKFGEEKAMLEFLPNGRARRPHRR